MDIGTIIEFDFGLYLLVDNARGGFLATPVYEIDHSPSGPAEFLSHKLVAEAEVVG